MARVWRDAATPLMTCTAASVLLLVSALGAGAQSLRSPVSAAGPGGVGVFSILLESQSDRPPVALQWELNVPPAISVVSKGIEAGEAARASAKILTCAERKRGSASAASVYTCILAGGVKAIPKGEVALVHYTTRPDSAGAPVRVAITGIKGAAGNAARIDMPDAEAIIRSH